MFYTTMYIADNYLLTKEIILLLIVTIFRVYYWLSVNTKMIYIIYIDILLYWILFL